MSNVLFCVLFVLHDHAIIAVLFPVKVINEFSKKLNNINLLSFLRDILKLTTKILF